MNKFIKLTVRVMFVSQKTIQTKASAQTDDGGNVL